MKDSLFAAHTMGSSLEEYVRIKMPQCLETEAIHTITVRGCYQRNDQQIFVNEKTDKLFNWKRPTYEKFETESLVCNCFPGVDYVSHYAQLIEAYSVIRGLDLKVVTELPGQSDTLNTLLEETNISKIPKADIFVLGIVHHFFANDEFEGDGEFMWRQEVVEERTILYLGCKFSIWGDIAGEVLRVLAASNNTARFIYVGKLGALENREPNRYLVTGDYSYVDGVAVVWDNIFSDTIAENVIKGKHVTLPSVMEETKVWHEANVGKFSFVDPEIGKLAKAANEMGVIFSYLHIVSDCLTNTYSENLSNERNPKILEKRNSLLTQLAMILVEKKMMSNSELAAVS